MKIIERYFLKEFLRLFLLMSVGLGFIYSLIELVNKIEGFAPYKPSTGDLIFYSALNLPGYLVYLMPMATLISSLFVISHAGRKKETTAIKAGGGSVKKILRPLVYTGMVIGLAGFMLSEFVVPDFSKMAHELSDSITKKQRLLAFKEGTAWLRTKDRIIKLGVYLPERDVIKGVSIMRVAEDMLVERIEAAYAEWRPAEAGLEASNKTPHIKDPSSFEPSRGGAWNLKDVTVYDIKSGKIKAYKELQSDIIDPPEILAKGMQKPEEMNVRELFAYTKRLKEAGIKNVKMAVDINSRLSFPLINIIMVMLGLSLAGIGRMESGLVTTAIAVFVSLLYWLGYTSALSLGYTGLLPPMFAAWLVPLIFGGAAFYLFYKIPE